MKNKNQSNAYTSGNALDLNKTWKFDNKNVKYDPDKGFIFDLSDSK